MDRGSRRCGLQRGACRWGARDIPRCVGELGRGGAGLGGWRRQRQAMRQVFGGGLSDALRPYRVRSSLDRRDKRRFAIGMRGTAQGTGCARRSRPSGLPCRQLVPSQHPGSCRTGESRRHLAGRCAGSRTECGRTGVSRRTGRHHPGGARCKRSRTRWLDRAGPRVEPRQSGRDVPCWEGIGCQRKRANKRHRYRSVLRYAGLSRPSGTDQQDGRGRQPRHIGSEFGSGGKLRGRAASTVQCPEKCRDAIFRDAPDGAGTRHGLASRRHPTLSYLPAATFAAGNSTGLPHKGSTAQIGPVSGDCRPRTGGSGRQSAPPRAIRNIRRAQAEIHCHAILEEPAMAARLVGNGLRETVRGLVYWQSLPPGSKHQSGLECVMGRLT